MGTMANMNSPKLLQNSNMKRKKSRNKRKKILFGENTQNHNNLNPDALINQISNQLKQKNKNVNFSPQVNFSQAAPSESAYSIADSVANLAKQLEEANSEAQSVYSERTYARSEAMSIADSVAEIAEKLNHLNNLNPHLQAAYTPSESGTSYYSVNESVMSADQFYSAPSSVYS